MGYIGQIKDTDGTTHNIGATLYGTCTTSLSTVAKTVTCSEFDTLITGATIQIYFSQGNMASSPTLNINSTGAKPIYPTDTTWEANSTLTFVYDGTNWKVIGNVQTQTYYTTCSTAANSATKITTVNAPLKTGIRLYVSFTNANSSNDPKLSISGSASSAVAISPTNLSWTAGDIIEFVYNGTNWIAIRPYSNSTIGTGSITSSVSASGYTHAHLIASIAPDLQKVTPKRETYCDITLFMNRSSITLNSSVGTVYMTCYSVSTNAHPLIMNGSEIWYTDLKSLLPSNDAKVPIHIIYDPDQQKYVINDGYLSYAQIAQSNNYTKMQKTNIGPSNDYSYVMLTNIDAENYGATGVSAYDYDNECGVAMVGIKNLTAEKLRNTFYYDDYCPTAGTMYCQATLLIKNGSTITSQNITSIVYDFDNSPYSITLYSGNTAITLDSSYTYHLFGILYASYF